MASDLSGDSDAIEVRGARLLVAHSISETYSVSVERKIVQTEYSETVMRAKIGVARARFTWPVVAMVIGSAVVAIAIICASIALNFKEGVYVAGAVFVPGGLAGLLRALGVGPKDDPKD